MSSYATCECCGLTTYFEHSMDVQLCPTCARKMTTQDAKEAAEWLVAYSPHKLRGYIVARAYLALSARQGEDGWQPIETAPKDQWIMGHGSGTAIENCPFICEWYGKKDGWQEVYSNVSVTPTHWKPLDPPPSPSGEGEIVKS